MINKELPQENKEVVLNIFSLAINITINQFKSIEVNFRPGVNTLFVRAEDLIKDTGMRQLAVMWDVSVYNLDGLKFIENELLKVIKAKQIIDEDFLN